MNHYKSLHDNLLRYCQFRARAVGYRFSGKRFWEQLKLNQPIRGAVGWSQHTGAMCDPEYPFLLLHFNSVEQERNL